MTRPARLAALALAALLAACSSKTPRAITVRPTVREMPAILRNTVGSRGTLRGITPTIVSGYGFVVGLNGTGGGDLDANVQQTMERMLGLGGISRGNPVLETMLTDPITGQGRSPRELLRDPNTAVVIVQAAVPPGAPLGYAFDTYVTALNATSLEGGRLWTADLSIGLPRTFGGYQTKRIAQARGAVFVSAFVEPGVGSAGVDPTIGRVLDGGRVVEPLSIELALDTPSPILARRIVEAINSRFPEGPGDTGPVARGRTADSIAISVPDEYRDNPGDFVLILEHVTIDTRFADQIARGYVEAIKENPGLADELSWCLVGLGDVAKKHLSGEAGLYENPQLAPRLAGLRAGALLGDARAAVELEELARNAPSNLVRAEAITLLAELSAGPRIDMTLRELAESEGLSVRVAAYEGLARRAERSRYARLARMELAQATPASEPTPREILESRARAYLPADSLQGVGRALIEGKFFLDRVGGGSPLTYVTQQGVPRIVLFGERAALRRPLFVSAWSDRFLMISESETDPVRVRYRDEATGKVTQQQIEADLPSLIWFLAHEPSPEDPRAGLGMSYSEVVGVLYRVHEQGAAPAAFATENDRLLAALLEANRDMTAVERPETAGTNAPERTERPEETPEAPLRTTPSRVPEVVPIIGG